MYLFDEQPIVANKTLARELGLNEALVLQQINYWIEINKKSGKNYHDGKYWTYNSIRAWQENDFDYMSFDTVKRTFSKLEKAGYLLVGNYNKDPRDKTKWYTINNDKLEELYMDMDLKKQKIQTEALKNSMPNALGQNAPMDKGKISQCNNADCTNAQVQNALMQKDNLHQPLPENTTNNTTNNSAYISIHPSIKEKNQLFSENMKGGRIDISYKNIYQNCLEELRHQTGYYIEPYIDEKFQNNILLTQTERLTMNGRPKNPKYARNKNVLVIGGSGSGKTRFYVKPNLMQMHSSYCVTDPKGTIRF